MRDRNAGQHRLWSMDASWQDVYRQLRPALIKGVKRRRYERMMRRRHPRWGARKFRRPTGLP